jgi:hypothetical protein
MTEDAHSEQVGNLLYQMTALQARYRETERIFSASLRRQRRLQWANRLLGLLALCGWGACLLLWRVDRLGQKAHPAAAKSPEIHQIAVLNARPAQSAKPVSFYAKQSEEIDSVVFEDLRQNCFYELDEYVKGGRQQALTIEPITEEEAKALPPSSITVSYDYATQH